MSDFTKWVDLVNKLRTETAALTAERDRLKTDLAELVIEGERLLPFFSPAAFPTLRRLLNEAK